MYFRVSYSSTCQLHLQITNWFASGQLGFLTVVVLLISLHWPRKAPLGRGMYVCFEVAKFIAPQGFCMEGGFLEGIGGLFTLYFQECNVQDMLLSLTDILQSNVCMIIVNTTLTISQLSQGII